MKSYRCGNCKAAFDSPSESLDETEFRKHHDAEHPGKPYLLELKKR